MTVRSDTFRYAKGVILHRFFLRNFRRLYLTNTREETQKAEDEVSPTGRILGEQQEVSRGVTCEGRGLRRRVGVGA